MNTFSQRFSDCVSITGGWEILYDFADHLLGKSTKFSGVQMHIGHFLSHVNERIQRCNPKANGFFSDLSGRIFLQSGLAARLQALPNNVREPCCSLRYVGGDGTAIGVPILNLGGIKPVWDPPLGCRAAHKKWGRMDRCAIGNSCGDASQAKKCREFIAKATSSSISTETRLDVRSELDSISESLPAQIFALLESWLGMSPQNPKWEPLRHLLRACAYQDSLCGVISLRMIPSVKRIIQLANKSPAFETIEEIHVWDSLAEKISRQGLGPYIAITLKACKEEYLRNNQAGRDSLILFSAFLQSLGKAGF